MEQKEEEKSFNLGTRLHMKAPEKEPITADGINNIINVSPLQATASPRFNLWYLCH